MTNAWFVVAAPGANQGTVSNPVIPSGSEIIEVTEGGADYNTLLNDGTITVSGKQWTTVMGPFNSLADAQAAKPAGMSTLQMLAGGLVGGTELAMGTTPTTAAGSATEAASATGGLDDFLEFPEKALGWISNRANIVRVVKVVVGSLMIITGINMLVKDTTNIDVGGAVKSAAKVVM